MAAASPLRTTRRRTHAQRAVAALRLLTVAFTLHWAWEGTHAIAYVESTGPFVQRLRHCLPMAGVDAVWTVALWLAAVTLLPGPDRDWRRLVLLAAFGALTATIVEQAALAEGRWTYNALMPIVPLLEVGLWPLLQMIVLPAISVLLAGEINRSA